LRRAEGHWVGAFQAMASPCEVLLGVETRREARDLARIAYREALRIETQFSRYREDGAVARINRAEGAVVTVDEETAGLLDFAAQCHAMSDGAFDITSGVLRRVWTFDGSDRVPSPEAVLEVLPRVGWSKVTWERPRLRLEPGMEIDLGGIAKEYAVDRAAALVREKTAVPLLVNFGGDIAADREDEDAWRVGIETPDRFGEASGVVRLRRGGLASSGDTRRFLLRDGVRYSHVLDPRTGWPVEHAPRSVTVLAENCTAAGLLATLALLQGEGAAAFLEAQGVRYWCGE